MARRFYTESGKEIEFGLISFKTARVYNQLDGQRIS